MSPAKNPLITTEICVKIEPDKRKDRMKREMNSPKIERYRMTPNLELSLANSYSYNTILKNEKLSSLLVLGKIEGRTYLKKMPSNFAQPMLAALS